MAKRLKDNLSSGFFEAANKLNSKSARQKIVAYVESYDDVFFWRTVLSKFETDRWYFQVTLPSRSPHLERGKKAVLMSLLKGKVGGSMIACVDADYDYLIQGRTAVSKEIISSPYIFHTYAYAIENLQCYASSLHDVCVAVSLNDHNIFDIASFLRSFSEIIYPLFVWNIWFYRTPNYSEFTMTDFLHAIEIGNVRLHEIPSVLERLRHRVSRKTDELRHRKPMAKQSWLALREELKELGVRPDNTYLYIQGHHLFDKVVVPLLGRICDELVKERQDEISRQSVHATQARNELSCYMNSLGDVEQMLKKNLGYEESEPFKRIQADVSRFMADKHSCRMS
ncbi:MAG: DUF4435 domain-containing protein [Prevotella sp.]|nr:DUF4435 domain-containing protein [Prevotella sp.]